MIVIVDDEKWIIGGIIDYLEDRAERIDNRYTPKFFNTPVKAIEFIKKNSKKIDIIISDIGMDYGDGDLNKEEKGGTQFINNISQQTNIPIIINTIHNRQYFENELTSEIDNNNLYYINRNDDADSNELYKIIDKNLKI